MKHRETGQPLLVRLRRTSPNDITSPVRRLTSGLGAVGLCLAVATMAGPAAATVQGAAPEGRAVPSTDPSLVAGYLAEPAGGLTSGSLRFKIPTVKCKGDEPRAVTVGLGDVHDLESPRLRAHAVLDCPGDGPASYTLAVVACSQSAGPLATKHGRHVSVALEQSGGSLTVSVTDEKTEETITATDSTANCAPSGPIDAVLFGAFPVFEPALLEVPNFNKVKPRDAVLNGADLRGERVDRQTKPGIKTGGLHQELRGTPSASAGVGNAYSLKYKDVVHCCLRQMTPSGAR